MTVPAASEGLVLVVDDDPGTRKVAKANLSLEGFEVLVASSGAEALSRLDDSDPLAVVSDLKMPDMDGIALMDRVHALRPSLPVVLVTAHATVETAVEAMRKGALHYLTKPTRYDELALVLRHAVAHERQRRDVARLRGELEQAAGFEEIVGTSPAMREVFSIVEQVADSDATVLLRGETGTGKELVARAIHAPLAARRTAVRGRELRGAPARRSSRASSSATRRARSPARWRAGSGRFEQARRRDALPRRDRRARPRHAGEAAPRAPGAASSARRRPATRSASTSASWPRRTAISRRWCARGASATTSTTA